MKRFLIVSVVCLMSFGARASLLSRFVDECAKDVVLMSIPDEKIDEKLRSYIDQKDYETMQQYGEGFYLSNLKGSAGNGAVAFAAHMPLFNIIQLDKNLFDSGNTARIQSFIHHEVQHLKDAVDLHKKYSDISIDSLSLYSDFLPGDSLNDVSSVFWTAITEARAYSEQAVFLYNKKNELYNRMEIWKDGMYTDSFQGMILQQPDTSEYLEKAKIAKEEIERAKKNIESFKKLGMEVPPFLYEIVDTLEKERLVWGMGFDPEEEYKKAKEEYEMFEKEYEEEAKTELYLKVFDKAKKSGKSDEEARHMVVTELLNSDFFKVVYIDRAFKQKHGSQELSVEEMLSAFDDTNITKEEFYGAEQLWINVCNNDKATESKDCEGFWGRYETKYCPDLREKWKNCDKLKKVIDVEDNCEKCKKGNCSEHTKRRLISQNDEESHKKCCAYENFPLARKETK